MKIILTCPRVSLRRFHPMALQGFFPRYQFVEFANCTIWVFFHTNKIID